jgi:hypothetical protein
MKNQTKYLFFFLLLTAWCGNAQIAHSDKSENPLLIDFKTPPNTAQPRVWWHWMNGNITKEGIQKDLEWMKKSGIGGFQNFDASLMTPQIVGKRLEYMTPEWKDAFKFTTELANKMGLEMAIAGSPGWSESGGPWVSPADGMKKIVWTETLVKGGQAFSGSLPKPPTTTGKFQNLPIEAEFGSGQTPKVPEFYQDIAVIAFKLPNTENLLSDLKPTITSSSGSFNLAQLTDGDLVKTNLLPADAQKGIAWIQYTFENPTTIKAVTLVGGGDRGPFGLYGELKDTRGLEASDDGLNFKKICFIPAGNLLQQTITVPPTTTKFFRVTFNNPPPPPNLGALMGVSGDAPKLPTGTDIAELVLHTATRVNRFEEKAGYAISNDSYINSTPTTEDIVATNQVIDVTKSVNTEGVLNWTAPAGTWKIVRFGYSLTGKENHPASPEATGLEVDKLNPTAINAYFNTYLDKYKDATGGLMGEKGGLQYIVTDSYEAGAQNWTNNMIAEFEKRRGYSLIPWMPVLVGYVVKSAEASDNFLWDYRKTLGEMMVEYHYDGLTTLLKQRGLKRYTESHEDKRAMIADGMEVKRTAAVPMAAMWTANAMNGFSQVKYVSDIRESAAVAHIYGQNLVAAESMTAFGMGGSAWSYSPENLKSTADLEMAHGLNRFVIHTSVHQPMDDKMPGLGLGPFGQWFNRHETWANQASAWTNYLSRSCYMLQQGKFVAEILYYYGEDNNVTSLFGNKLPNIPEGYNFDFVNADALVNVLQVKNGTIITPSGMSYRILVLDENAKKMSLPVLKKIRDMVKAGAKVTGIKPEKSPSLNDNDAEFQALVAEIWEKGNPNVSVNQNMGDILRGQKIDPDFTYAKPQVKTEVLYVHRNLIDQDIYWLNNRNDRVENIEASFRIEGKLAEIWNAQTGEISKASYKSENGRTTISLHLEPFDAYFIVFKDKTTQKSLALPKTQASKILEIKSPWVVSFQEGRGAPKQTTFNKLQSFTDKTEEGIRYFSGTASYKTSFKMPKISTGSTYEMDLGEVKTLAEVILNGKSMGIVWKKPFRLKITEGLKKGGNTVEIKVTNLWVNRLIGDAQPNVKAKIAYTTMPFYQANSPLLPSGLMGPVVISASR